MADKLPLVSVSQLPLQLLHQSFRVWIKQTNIAVVIDVHILLDNTEDLYKNTKICMPIAMEFILFAQTLFSFLAFNLGSTLKVVRSICNGFRSWTKTMIYCYERVQIV